MAGEGVLPSREGAVQPVPGAFVRTASLVGCRLDAVDAVVGEGGAGRALAVGLGLGLVDEVARAATADVIDG